MSAPKIRTLTVKGKTYYLRFTAYSAYLLEKELPGRTVDDVVSTVTSGRAGVTELTVMLYAALEGYRRKARVGHPWTIEEVTDIIDNYGDVARFWVGASGQVVAAFFDSMPSYGTHQVASDSTTLEDPQRQDPTPAASDSAAQTEASTGTST